MQLKKPPFFIVGCERSGTTLLMVYLDSHPELAVPPESHIFHRFHRFLPGFGDLKEAKYLRRFVKELLADVWIERWGLSLTVDDFLRTLEEPSFRGCVVNLFNCYAQQKGKPYWGEKTPVHVMHIPKILKCFSDAKFIHVVRDGRDTVQSLKNVWFGPETPLALARHWQGRIHAFDRAKEILPESQYHEVKYEDFLQNPNDEFQKITAFLDVAPLEVREKIPETDLQKFFSRPGGDHIKLKGNIKKSKIGVYKDFFNLREIGIIESVVGEELRKYGYGLETNADTVPTAVEKLVWKIHEWFHAARYQYFNTRFFHKAIWQIRIRKWSGFLRKMKWRFCGK